MKFVIYGAGWRGSRLLEYLGKSKVIAFIDSDKKKQGQMFYGKPIIGIDGYKSNYEQYYIIISTLTTDEIESKLCLEGLCQFSTLTDMPSEYKGYGNCSIEECYGRLKKRMKKGCVIYGLNAFSLILYEYFNTYTEVCILPEKKDNKKVNWLKKKYPQISLIEDEIIDKEKIILVTTEHENSLSYLIRFKKNEIVDMFEYANNLSAYYNKKIKKLNNAYIERKRCFIVATGPSLSKNDLEILRQNNEFCFSVNQMCLNKEGWIASAYVCTDCRFISEHKRDIKDYPSELKFIADGNNGFWTENHENTYKYHASFSAKTDFSENICQKIYAGYTVTYVCMQIAVYLGFKEIYLLGVDCNYIKGSTKNYFVIDEKPDMFDHYVDKMLESYEVAKKYADSHGIKIFNATRGGKLEVFERIDFDELFKRGESIDV